MAKAQSALSETKQRIGQLENKKVEVQGTINEINANIYQLKAQLVQFETTFSAKQANLQAGINQDVANAAKEYQLFLSSHDPNERAYHLSENQAWVQTAQENRNRMAHNAEVAAQARNKINTAVTQGQKTLFADQDLLAGINGSIKDGNAEVADLELKLQGLRMDKLKQGWGFTSGGPQPQPQPQPQPLPSSKPFSKWDKVLETLEPNARADSSPSGSKSEDAELVATFAASVEETVTSLGTNLLDATKKAGKAFIDRLNKIGLEEVEKNLRSPSSNVTPNPVPSPP
jgi:hypothetical protein